MGYTGYGTINNAIQSELTEQNEIAMATSFTTEGGVMNIKVQSQLLIHLPQADQPILSYISFRRWTSGTSTGCWYW